MPEPKPPPPPPSPVEALSAEELCAFVKECLGNTYGSDFLGADQVAANFREQLIDGARVKHLQPRDWKRLCPCIGPRTLLQERLKNYGTAPSAPSPAAPPAPPVQMMAIKAPTPPAADSGGPAAQAPPSKANGQEVSAAEDSPTVDMAAILAHMPVINCETSSQENGVHAAHAHPPKPLKLPQPALLDPEEDLTGEYDDSSGASPVSASGRGFSAEPPQHTEAKVSSSRAGRASPEAEHGERNGPTHDSHAPGKAREHRTHPGVSKLSWGKMLGQRSRYSNHRLIDCPWQPDVHKPWVVQLGQVLFFELMRAFFYLFIIRKFGLRLRQVPYFAVPVISTWLSLRYQWYVDFQPPLYTTIVVFPLSFSLIAAYQRREQALSILASIKASAQALYLFSVCWTTTQTELPRDYLVNTSQIVRATFRNFGHYLTAISESERETMLGNIYLQYQDLFYQVDLFRLAGIGPPLVTVPFNNAINLILGFERLRVFSDYRTPCTIRSYCTSCISILAFTMGPFFANIGRNYHPFYAYMLCLVFFWLLQCMSNIQAMLENPYVTFGRGNAEDDINLVPLMGVAALKKKRRRKFKGAEDAPR
eukprot:GGOE01018906.1.p1 GENE.GGOE01018906.1~~GGOE01018906.1.p1  ORF type:complete len:661 (+),score=177.39 GGOE01018906.1:210-1985(+)